MSLQMRWKALLKNLLMFALLLPALAAQAGPLIEVFKSPDCGCCGDWVKHLQTNGFDVRVRDVAEPGEHRRRLGIPDELGACHTATAGAYVIEGHVPAREIRRLLKEKPKALGLSVPGMPAGSPGMEGPRPVPYQVLLVELGGRHRVYQSY